MTEEEKTFFYESLNNGLQKVYEIHNLLTVGDITLIDAMDIYARFVEASSLLEEISKLIKNKNIYFGEIKKRIPELRGIILFEFSSILLFGPLGIILNFPTFKKVQDILNNEFKNAQKIPLDLEKAADILMMKYELFSLKLIKPLMIEEDKESLSEIAAKACISIHDYVFYGNCTFHSNETMNMAIKLLQQNIGTDLTDIELLLEIFKAKYQAYNVTLKRENPKLKGAN